MSKQHDDLFDAAEKAADRLHSDTSVSLDETRRSLSALRDHVEMLLDAVKNSRDEDAED